MFFLGEVVHIIGEGILTGDDRTGEDEFFGLTNFTEDRGDDEKKSESLSGIFTGVDGRRGLVSPLFGLRGSERLGPPKGLDAGLG